MEWLGERAPNKSPIIPCHLAEGAQDDPDHPGRLLLCAKDDPDHPGRFLLCAKDDRSLFLALALPAADQVLPKEP